VIYSGSSATLLFYRLSTLSLSISLIYGSMNTILLSERFNYSTVRMLKTYLGM